MSEVPLIDRAALDELVDSIGAEGARSVIELFIAESRGYLATIAAAAASGNAVDRDRARRAAHSLKSSAGQVGAVAMAAAAIAVEREAAENAADLTQRIAALDHCAADTEVELARFLQQ